MKRKCEDEEVDGATRKSNVGRKNEEMNSTLTPESQEFSKSTLHHLNKQGVKFSKSLDFCLFYSLPPPRRLSFLLPIDFLCQCWSSSLEWHHW